MCVCVCVFVFVYAKRKAGGVGDGESPWQPHCWPLDTPLVSRTAPALLTDAASERRSGAERRNRQPATGSGGGGRERKDPLVQKKVTLWLVTQRAEAECDAMRPDG